MGRSVSTYGEYNAIINHEPQCTCTDENDVSLGLEIYECQECNKYAWDELRYILVQRLMKKYPSVGSLLDEQQWEDNEGRIIAENEYAKFILSEYGGIVSLSVSSKDEELIEYSEYGKANFANAWVSNIREGFEKEFSDYKRIARLCDGTSVYERA